MPFCRFIAPMRSTLASAFVLVCAQASGAADFPTVAGTGTISAVTLGAPTTRYDHFVQGRDYEASGMEIRLASGAVLMLSLPETLVFEDTTPLVDDLDGDGSDEVVTILSSLTEGAAIAVFEVRDGAIVLRARTDFIGQSHRWRNLAGLGDFDGDGMLDIASVAMPHLIKRLEVHTLQGDILVRIGTGEGFSNHRLGSPHTDMALVDDFDGDGIMDLALPDAERTAIRLVGFAGRRLTEIAHLPLPAPADGEMNLAGDGQIEIGLANGTLHRTALPGQ